MLRFIRRLPLFILLFGLLLVISPAHAQVEPALSITKIETDHFPNVKVYLRGENLGVSLSELALTLIEDGQEIATHSGAKIQEVSTQTAILFDASRNISNIGQTGMPRNREVGEVTFRFIKELKLLSEKSLLAAYAPNKSGNLSDIQNWTGNHQDVANKVYDDKAPPSEYPDQTPLFDLILQTLNRFDKLDKSQNNAKRIVLFSDGTQGNSKIKLEDIVSIAKDKQIQIYTVLLGPEEEGDPNNMSRIAQLTGGQYYQLTTIEALDDLWKRLGQDEKEFVLSYRSQQQQPKEIFVSAMLPNRKVIETKSDLPPFEIQQVEIEILRPAIDGFPVISKSSVDAMYNTPVEQLEPKTIDIQVKFSWPDGYPRNLKRVEYKIGDKIEVPQAEPFNQISFPIEHLDKGHYTIRVTAIDELDIRSESSPLPFSVDVIRPDEPTPTPYKVFGFPVTQSEVNTLLIIITLLFSLLAVMLAIRKSEVRDSVVKAVHNTIQAITEPFRLNKREASKGPEVKAILTVQDPGRAASLASTINVYAGRTTKIGRASEFAEIVIEDQRVSRVHCRIIENPDGKLSLYDEGGASGTYINFEPIEISGHILQSGDLINVGPVKFRFDYKNDHNGNNPPYDLPKDPDGPTEPFQPIAPK